MAMLSQCFFCKREIVIPSGEKTYELKDYKDLKVFEKYKKENPYAPTGEYCCEVCFNREILPNLFQ